jgi:hypothetical protein
MPCPFCVLVFEQIDAQYVGHILFEHPQAQLGAGAALLLVPLFFRKREAQLAAFVGITALAFFFLHRGVR